MTRRTDRVEDLLRSELASLLLREVADPRIRTATVSWVDVAPNLERARVAISYFGDDDSRRSCIEALNHAAGFLRTQLGRRLRLRRMPQLIFELDRGPEHSARISQLLEELHDDESST